MSQDNNQSEKFNIKNFLYKHRFFLVFLVFNIFVHRKILAYGTQIAYGDFSPFPIEGIQPLYKFYYRWFEKGLGLSRTSGGVFPLIQFLLIFLFRKPLIAQKLYLIILPSLAYISFSYFIRTTVRLKKVKYADFVLFALSTFHAFSPIALGEFTGGSLYSTMLLFALFPFLYTSTFKLLKNPSLQRIFIHGLLLGLLISIYLHTVVIYFMTLLAPFILDLVKDKLKAIKKWFNFVYTAMVAVFLNPILFFTSFNILQNTSSGGEKKSFVDNTARFLSEIKYTYITGKFLPAIRIGSFGAFEYFKNPVWTYPFYLVVLFVLGFAIYRMLFKKDKDKILLVSFLNFMGLVLFIFFTYKEWLYPLYIKIPVLFMFRNPSKLTYMSTFFFLTLFYYSWGTFAKLKIKSIFKVAVLLLLTIIQFAYIWPVFLGDRGLASKRVEHYTIPEYFHEAATYIKDNRTIAGQRSVWLPAGHEATFIKLLWIDRTKLDAQIGMQEFAGAAFENDIIGASYSALMQEDSNAFINTLKIALVDYMVLLKDDYFYKLNNFSVEEFENVLQGIPVVKSTPEYDIYHIYSKTPLIYSPKKLTTSNLSDSGNYYMLSRANTDEIQTIVPLDKVNQFQISPVDNSSFLFSQGTPKLTTNVEWQSNWVWKTPAIYPKIPELPTRDTETATYLEESMAALAEISEFLTSQKNVPSSDVQTLLDSYSNILGIYTNFVQGIPPERLDNNTKIYLTKLYLYVERSLENLKQAGLLTPTIRSQYVAFYKSFEQMTSSDCTYDYCFNFGIGKPTGYEMEIYDLNKETLDNSFFINEKAFPLVGHTVSDKWTKVSNVYFEPGNYKTGIDLNLESKPYSYDNYTKSIIVPNDDLHKYKNSFLYSFDEDVYLTLTYTPDEDTEKQESYLVWKGTLANTKNSNFCYKKIDGKCYRLFLSQLQPTTYKESNFAFDKNIALNKGGPNEIRDFEVVELKYPTLYLQESTQNAQENTELNPPDIEFEKINPTKYKVRIRNISEDFMLVFNQSFNTKWILQGLNKERIADNRHFKVNYFANAWWIKTADLNGATETELDLIFYPQRFVWLSLASTIMTLSVSIYVIFIRKPSHTSDKIK